MKMQILIFLLFIGLNLKGQTAEQILAISEEAYHQISNYVDEGEFEVHPFNVTSLAPTHYQYFLAIDSTGNVNHRFVIERSELAHGYTYYKKAGEEKGELNSIGENPMTYQYDLSNAAGLMGGGGDGLFFEISLLMNDEFYPMEHHPLNPFHSYVALNMLPDTIIQDQPCYGIVLTNQYLRVEDIAYNADYHAEPVTKTYVAKYFIRKNDYMIVRREDLYTNGDEKYFLLRYQLNPKINVKGFEQYLVHD